MPKSFAVLFTHSSIPQGVEVRGDMPDAAWHVLLRFAQYAEELVPLMEGIEVNCNIHWEVGVGFTGSSTLPSLVQYKALLHGMRPFVLQEGDTYFFKVCKILSRYVRHSELPDLTQRAKDRFSGKEFQSQVKIFSRTTVLNAASTLITWLNAFEYHRDIKKQEEMNALHQGLPQESILALYLLMVIAQARAVVEVARLIRFLDSTQEASLDFRI